MTQDLFWLTLTILLTALMWVPYVLNRIAAWGLMEAMANPAPDTPPVPAWAVRAKLAHQNAIENLAVFAALVFAVHIAGAGSPLTATASMVYFFARAGHFLIYSLGVPVLRTLLFAVGFAAQMALVLRLLGIV